MGAHAKETDKREKYGLWVIWTLVVLVGLVSMMLVFGVATFGNFWAGVFLGVLVIVGMARLVIYTRDLIKATA